MLLEYSKRSGTSKEPVSLLKKKSLEILEGNTEYLGIPATGRNCLLSKLPFLKKKVRPEKVDTVGIYICKENSIRE